MVGNITWENLYEPFTYKTAVKNVGGVVVIDKKGRIVIPEPVKVKANKEWGDEAFLKAGEATFGN